MIDTNIEGRRHEAFTCREGYLSAELTLSRHDQAHELRY